MSRIRIDKVKVGMILGGDAHSCHGRLLLRAGMEITDEHIRILRTWGVPDVLVDGDTADPTGDTVAEEVSPEELQSIKDELMPLYRHTDLEHPAMRELLHLAALRRLTHG